ncbi:hypothetical protein CSC70_10785 [Pseudoxanthomonas kalamensis DSM 18571]|uniref:hypothetical protein n=1 Tax=Pseudoxanthomonas kalamensis TaxID=289483 RepID=UPI001390DEFB|nr:hypothetical protein [Pseudoxanthomonas kalamensis]KAF1709290.1 hypothetical protein CSC70_10785 [Pseudoxanthomonas kalamensis DSM 18571]
MNYLLPAAVALLALAPVAQADDSPAIDLTALIECGSDYAGFVATEALRDDPLKAVAAGWQPLPQTNMFMSEYRLVQPITVFGQPTDHIAFSGSGVVAILDLPDPRPLAQMLELETAIDTPQKAMFGKEVLSEKRTAPDGTVVIESAVITVSNVDSHPGQTLAGCSYSLDLPEETDEQTAPAAETPH